MRSDRLLEQRLLEALRTGPLPARELLARAAGASQPTVSRALSGLGDQVLKLGAARATHYARSREVRGLGSSWPLYRIDAEGRAQSSGRLQAVTPKGFHLELVGGDPHMTGLFPSLPPLMADLRPHGFAGSEFARRRGPELRAPESPAQWSDDVVLHALLAYGDDLPGDLIVGEAMLERAQRRQLAVPVGVAADARASHYLERAERALRGEDVSWLRGQFAKFATCVRDDEHSWRPVVVKFSGATSTPSKRRWVDLLVCEYLALETLRAAGLDAARSELIIAGERIALEVTRFDRVGAFGRRGLSTLAVLDRAHDDWLRAADRLQTGKRIDAAEANQLRLWFWFGALIANEDMHFGNVAFTPDARGGWQLAPCHDMLPMRYRPSGHGEVIERVFTPPLPPPEHVNTWRIAATLATRFWNAVAEDRRISPPFRNIATENRDAVLRARAVVG